jgi:hypothetical protein
LDIFFNYLLQVCCPLQIELLVAVNTYIAAVITAAVAAAVVSLCLHVQRRLAPEYAAFHPQLLQQCITLLQNFCLLHASSDITPG